MVNQINQYLQNPVGHGDNIYFLSQQALFCYNQSSKQAFRMCSFDSEISDLKISKDGLKLSFFAKEDSNGDIYLYDMQTNTFKRISFFDDPYIVNLGITDNNAIFASCYKSPFFVHNIYSTNIDTLEYELKYKSCSYIATSNDTVVLQQFGYGYHTWKNYQGGTAARLYCSKSGSTFQPLQLPKNNCYSPIFVNKKLYFITDANGNANIHTYDFERNQVIQKTFLDDFYIRDISNFNEDKILFSSGGDIYSYDTNSENTEKIIPSITDYSSLSRSFVLRDISAFATSCAISDDAKISFASRGHVFLSESWSNSYLQLTDKIRYRKSIFLSNEKVLLIFDNQSNSIVEIYDCKKTTKEKTIKLDIPLIQDVEVISQDLILIQNTKGMLWILDLKSEQSTKIVEGKLNKLAGCDVSLDKKWIVYSTPSKSTEDICSLFLYNVETSAIHKINTGSYNDYSPSFSKDGKYIYFLSDRKITPKWDQFFFNMYFEVKTSVCAICLNSEVENPFKPSQKHQIEDETKKSTTPEGSEDSTNTPSSEDVKKEDAKKEVEIRLNELNLVISEVQSANYISLESVSDSKILLVEDEEKTDEQQPSSGHTLKCYDIPSSQISPIMSSVEFYSTSQNREWMILKSKEKFRIGKTAEMFDDNDKSYKNGGWLDTSAITLKVNPKEEWENILKDQSFLVSYNFWRDIDLDLSKYEQLLPKINSKEDLNKVIEEINGELRSSHAYIIERANTEDTQHEKDGYLAAETKWNGNGYEITSIEDLPEFSLARVSPLLEQGSKIKLNDTIVAIDGIKCSKDRPIESYLSHKNQKNVHISFLNSKNELEHTTIKLTCVEKQVEYIKWVNNNRKHVHQMSGNRIGYIHVPDASNWGFKEFHKSYINEREMDALIIDARYNRGGNISGLIINILSNIQTGFETFKNQQMAWPFYSNKGKLLMLCNEKSSSDGDLIVYSFKKRGLGKVVGKRTWGGIIGICPRDKMVDGTLTSQPEYALLFENEKAPSIENEGIHPDIEIQNSIEDLMNNRDSQLEHGIKILLNDLNNKLV